MARSRANRLTNQVSTLIGDSSVSPDPVSYDADEIYSKSYLQPYGCLLVFDPMDGTILQMSANAGEYFGFDCSDSSSAHLLGQSLTQYLSSSHWEALQQLLLGNEGWVNPLHLAIVTSQGSHYFEAVAHLVGSDMLLSMGILELAPLQTELVQEVENPQPAKDNFSLIRLAVADLQRASDLPSFLQQAAQALQRLTGCDRAMIYQFDAKGAGQVVAEVSDHTVVLNNSISFLGRWFPAGDIPDPVREFYLHGGVRYVPDLNAPSIVLLPSINPKTQSPIDLTRATLRGVDRCCVEYHQTMGLAAFSVVPIVYEQRLWGLMSCHHVQPKFLSYETRAACELLSQFVAAELGKQLNQAALQNIVAFKFWQTQVIEAIAQAPDLQTGLLPPHPNFLKLVNATGAAICFGDEITLVGQTPHLEWVKQLLDWAAKNVSEDLFHTDSWSRHIATSHVASQTDVNQMLANLEFQEAVASGILILQISAVQRHTLIWFRPELLRTISWIGHPPDLHNQPQNAQRGPRESFAEWQETVRATSQPWQQIELENALALRNAIVGVVLQKAAELAQLNLELKRSNQELEAFAYAASHDLKEPLRGIYNSIIFLIEDYESVLDGAGIERLQNLMRLSRRMESLIDVLLQFSRLGQMALKMEVTDLNQIVAQELVVVRDSQTARPEVRIPRPLPEIVCDPILTREVFRNLLSNAFKYNDKPGAWVEVGYLEPGAATIPAELAAQPPPPTSAYVFFVRDNGIGIRDRHLDSVFRLFKRLHPQHLYGGGTGAGLTIVKKIIERQGGDITVQSQVGEGSTFYFTFGARLP